MMQFKVTAKHIRQQNTKSALVALFLVALSLGCVLAIVHAKSWVSMIFPLIGILTFSSAILSEYKIIKEGVAAYPILDFDKFAGKINVSCKEVVVNVDLTQTKNLRLQYTGRELVSIIVTASSGEVMRFVGYDNLELLAAELKLLTPPDNVTHAKHYHH